MVEADGGRGASSRDTCGRESVADFQLLLYVENTVWDFLSCKCPHWMIKVMVTLEMREPRVRDTDHVPVVLTSSFSTCSWSVYLKTLNIAVIIPILQIKTLRFSKFV